MTQTSLWQTQQYSTDYVELCNALYERELQMLAQLDITAEVHLQAKIKSLPHYVKRTAHQMTRAANPLVLDTQNASWTTKQSLSMPLAGQSNEQVATWYRSFSISLGLVVPIALETHIILDSIDRVDYDKQRFRTNVHGWFSYAETKASDENAFKGELEGKFESKLEENKKILKANKKIMMAACSGHCWQKSAVNNKSAKNKKHPITLSLRELLLACEINWKNFKELLIL
ncbi:MAG: hypothetical protein OCD00_02255 [Colwellia sp.]